jgi:secretion/DNA translocation related TadE-like protein
MRRIGRSEASAPTRGASGPAMNAGPISTKCGELGDTNTPISIRRGDVGETNASISGSRFRSTGTDKDRSPWRSEPRDRGSGTLWMLALIGLIWSVATMAMAVGGVRAARHRAYAAADLAALAAASHLADGAGSACELAARIARGSGGRLRQCVFHGRISDVVVVSEIRSIPALGPLTATARARAGPERAPGPCGPPLPCHTRPPPP